ncbi:MAG: hypothetical protein IJX28_03305 [Clostridia bacterium]|nr:hypothetical protein [Clostridia bacterium]
MSRLELTCEELRERIGRNHSRLLDPYYQIGEIYQPFDAKWPGDKEGRALLAFVNHANMTGFENPCMEPFLEQYPQRINEKGYLGPIAKDALFEQQLSGHSWMLRGLCAHYERYQNERSLSYAKDIVNGLFLPTRGAYATYPIQRDHSEGGVSGNSIGVLNGWRISTDIGCAFMSIDGLSHYYVLTKECAVRDLLDEMIEVYSSIDKEKLKAQTHCTLTAARGMLRMYGATGETGYLDKAKKIYTLYTTSGMTLTYQNLNWWGRPDSWTEPCAIVDSLILAGELYRITGEASYRRMAARIFHNGLASSQRPGGGAGTDSLVLQGQPYLFQKKPEAYFCCTMRLAEGLQYALEHREMLYAECSGVPTRDAYGRYMDGDILYAKPIYSDGRAGELLPLVKYFRQDTAVSDTLRQQIIFENEEKETTLC